MPKISLTELLSKEYKKDMNKIDKILCGYINKLFNIRLFPKIIESKFNPEIDNKLVITECFDDLCLIANDILNPEIIITTPTDIEIQELIIMLSKYTEAK